MVDELRVLRLMRSIGDDLAVLRHESGADDERRQDPLWLRGVKNSLVTAAEAIVDIARHVCATQGWGPPADNSDAVRLLGCHDVISPAIMDSMRQTVGLRDVLVNEYVEVDDATVTARLLDVADIEAFLIEVAVFVDPA